MEIIISNTKGKFKKNAIIGSQYRGLTPILNGINGVFGVMGELMDIGLV